MAIPKLDGHQHVLLLVVQPQLGPYGFTAYATLDADHIAAALQSTDTDRAEKIRLLSQIAVTKYQRIRYACKLLITTGCAARRRHRHDHRQVRP